VITSDGIIDQVGSLSNGKKASFGSSRFKTSLQDAKGNGCSYLVKQVIDDMKKWQGNETIRDDLMCCWLFPPLSGSDGKNRTYLNLF
jgi:serine phosphatase RsbU (regulator of sigma subunit)